MWKNYITVALRNLRRHPGYAALNVAGLVVGMAACLLIGLYVREELAYDRFHANADRVYRLAAGPAEEAEPTNANGGYSYGPALEGAFPEVEHAVRFVKVGWGEERVFAQGERRFYEGDFFFVEPAVFEVFTYPLAEGDPTTALAEPNTIVLTAAMAAKYFPGERPLGQTLQLDPFNDGRFTDYRVTGVLEPLPGPSHLPFDFLLSYASLPELASWGFDPVFTYVLLAPGASPDAIEARFPDFQQRYVGAERSRQLERRLYLQPLTDIHLRSHLNAELEPNGDVAYVYLFSAVAVLVLLLACINFVNLATARSVRRAQEVGLRKVLGAHRRQLVGQFLGEALLLSVLAAGLALALAALLLPVFNGIAGKSLSLFDAGAGRLAAGLSALTLVVGALAGSYPAFFLSAFQPAGVLKKGGTGGGLLAVRLREGLVVFQFAVSIGLIACTAVVARQMEHVRAMRLGFDRTQIVVLPLNDAIRANEGAFRVELLREPGIEAVALSEQVPARAGNGSGYAVEGRDEEMSAYRMFTDLHFIEAYGLEVVAGRGFSAAFPSDAPSAFVVNEAFVRDAGWGSPDEAVGKGIETGWADSTWAGHIVGVVEDFHLFSLRDSVYATVLHPMPLGVMNFVSARVAPGRVPAALAHLRATWERFSPAYPFDYSFLDEDFDQLHRADERLGQVFQAAALLAVLVACLGLFGLAAFVAEQRTKEIGVRKVLGATATSIVALLWRDFVRPVLAAAAVAGPLAYLAMERWLEGFVYRAPLGPGLFVLAGALTLLVALLTVGYQALRAASADPVHALRYE
jgi:putative ABC transport system permease protein